MKLANLIVIGGTIASGKTALSKKLPYPLIQEIDQDSLSEFLLKATYDKKRISSEVIEYYFLQKRFQKYVDYSRQKKLHIFDRSIFESLWFAKENLAPKSFKYFKRLWRNQVQDLIKTCGKPKFYFLLIVDWPTFKKNLFNRSLLSEVQNFKKNQTFFKNHVKNYHKYIKLILKEFKIDYFTIDASQKKLEDLKEIVLKKISKINQKK